MATHHLVQTVVCSSQTGHQLAENASDASCHVSIYMLISSIIGVAASPGRCCLDGARSFLVIVDCERLPVGLALTDAVGGGDRLAFVENHRLES